MRWLLIFLAIACGSSLAQDSVVDWRILPGERVGPIDASTSESDLRRVFGDTSIAPVEVYLGEGFSEPGTAVYPDDPERRVEVVWRNGERDSPKEVRLTGATSIWKTDEGISLGTTLMQLESLNGYPFRLAGFGFDYGGTVVDCGSGRLTYLGCDSFDRTLVVRFASNEIAPSPEYRQVVGDRIFSSGHPAMQALNPTIRQLIVLIGDQ
jgi:hypothetical protein